MDKATIMQALEKVIDPELGVPITKMDLIDEVEISGSGDVTIDFHLTMPFCPNKFALQIAKEIHATVSSLPGVGQVKVMLSEHVHADEINAEVNQ
ncbi:MAG: metal-sulfur cluster assembly factor [Terriglobia bacterium]